MNRKLFGLAVGAGVLAFGLGTVAHASTLDDVKKKGQLVCGVSTGLPGFSAPDAKGVWQGLDVDTC